MDTNTTPSSTELNMADMRRFIEFLRRQGHRDFGFMAVEGCNNIAVVVSSIPAGNNKKIDEIFLLGKTEDGELHSQGITSSVDTEESVGVLEARTEGNSLAICLLRKPTDFGELPKSSIDQENGPIFLKIHECKEKVETLRLSKTF